MATRNYEYRNRRYTDVKPIELWRTNKTLIVGYAKREVYARHASIWPPVRHKWANTFDPSELKKFLDGNSWLRDSVLQHRQGLSISVDAARVPQFGDPFWAAMAHLTPKPWDVVTDLDGGNDKASVVLSRLVSPFRDCRV